MNKGSTRNRLRQFRERSRLSLTEVATLTGFDVSTISKHENGQRGLTPEAITKYAKLYKVESYELFYLEVVTDSED